MKIFKQADRFCFQLDRFYPTQLYNVQKSNNYHFLVKSTIAISYLGKIHSGFCREQVFLFIFRDFTLEALFVNDNTVLTAR